MEVAGPLFRRFVELVTLSSIHIYGEPSEKALQQAHDKARLLGSETWKWRPCMLVSLAASRPRS
jgi:hypothetical protein